MAEYYPLLAKAVSSLSNATPETRHAIYERARKALLGQLRNLQPPVAEADIQRESQALDEAVARLETELKTVSEAVSPPVPETPAPLPPPPPLKPDVPPPPASAEPARQKPLFPLPSAKPWQPPPLRPAGTSVGRVQPSAGAASAPTIRPWIPPRPIRLNGAGEAAPVESEALEDAAVKTEPTKPEPVRPEPAKPEPPKVEALRLESAPQAEPVRQVEAAAAAADQPMQQQAAQQQTPQPSPPRMPHAGPAAMPKPRLEPQRPLAPQPIEAPGPHRRVWIVGVVVSLVVILVAAAAWKLRDRPEDMARLKAPPSQGQDATGGKIVERIGGGPVTTDGSKTANATADASQGADQKSGAPAQSTSGSAAGNASADTNAGGDTNPAVSVVHRAALLVEAPDEPNKVKTYIGTVVWRLDNVSNGPGQPLSTAVRADVDVPDDKFQVSLIFQKNIDATLPASHTIKIQFTVGPGSPSGGVKQINVPQMRREETATGEALSGIPVPIMENSFLIGLSRGTAEATNMELIKTREWIDLPILLANGHVAKLTFEKSTSGQRAIDDALASWQQVQ